MTEFDLQIFLRDMRQEQKDDMVRLSTKVDKISADLASHETRIAIVEGFYRAATWFTRVGAAAIITMVYDILKNHLPKLFAR